ncbi:MAG: [FeFe] hydrogenase H-cluster radical SAM maturase HydE [Pirellulales bacterium]|nr:[FeFe] hydrogenase H-cluster radical SAM maturase HydE [Pirellulales bacterium]
MMQRGEILNGLRESDTDRLADLWRRADRTRRRYVGDEVHLRGLIEWSNHCVRRCAYCGVRADNRRLTRYRLTDEEVLDCAKKAVGYGYGTVVLQAGEDPELTCRRVAGLVERIKTETDLAVTLSLGERSEEELAAWRRAGADRYLLRFETSNRVLYNRIHPPKTGQPSPAGTSGPAECNDRLTILGTLRHLGYEVGSGVMIGIPGQTYDDLADDLALFARLDLDMIGVGPYLCHPNTPLADRDVWPEAPADRQVPATEEMTYKVIALTRLVCPRANIPATTALATLNTRQGWEEGLTRGANVVMPNLTPMQYRALYEIYPDKACIAEEGESCHRGLNERLKAIGRKPGRGQGDSPNYLRHLAADGPPAAAGVDGCLVRLTGKN